MSQMLIILTTTPSKKEAKALSQRLLKSQLVACVQYHKIKSQYIWKTSHNTHSKICKQKEYLLILKTLPTYHKKIESLILKHHSYEVPEIIVFKANAQNGYQQWLHDTLQ